MPSEPNANNSDIQNFKICIVGLGLIGASLAKALRTNGFTGTINAWVRSESTLKAAVASNIADKVSTDPADVAADCDVVLLAVPMGVMRSQMETLAPIMGAHTIVTDAGSVKSSFVEDAQAVFGSMERIVPGHPIAGRESSGIDAAEAELFQSRMVLLTPTEETNPVAVQVVTEIWTLAGANVETIEHELHDNILAATSHLPHVLAFALVDNLAQSKHSSEIFKFAAGGFRDFTRIASGDPTMWRDICLTNTDAVLAAMDSFSENMAVLRKAVEAGESEAIDEIFNRAKKARDAHVHLW